MPTEERESLWILIAGPTIWSVHFLLCYLTAAVYCAKLWQPGAGISFVQWAVAIYTAVALAGIGLIAWKGLRRHSLGEATVPHDADTPEDRYRFLGFATLLLAGLSAVATVYVAMAAMFVGSCR